ncbi:MAG: (d)CMP kinase [Myxococcota bacterium]|nr:(d)CMP kinase [Myxococcota bacterium]
MIIAIDGPAGAGKTEVSKRLASALGFIRLDTGALYRAVAYEALRRGLSETSDVLEDMVASLSVGFGRDGVTLNGSLIEGLIRTPEMSRAASSFSAVPAVRRGLLALQRRLGSTSDCIVDGRDIGTVVFPQAEVKVFLTASAEVRAGRRYRQLQGLGQTVDYAGLLAEITERDRKDSERAIAPLRAADDAIIVDSSELDLDEVVHLISERVREARR